MLFQNTGSWTGNQIYKEQLDEGFEDCQAQFTHVAVMGGGPFVVEAVYPNSKETNISKAYRGRQIRIVTFDYPEYETKHRYHVGYNAGIQNNLKYGYISLLYWKLRDLIPISNNFLAKHKAPFCSMLALSALYRQIPKAHGMVGTDPEESMPAYLSQACFKPIWEGVIP